MSFRLRFVFGMVMLSTTTSWGQTARVLSQPLSFESALQLNTPEFFQVDPAERFNGTTGFVRDQLFGFLGASPRGKSTEPNYAHAIATLDDGSYLIAQNSPACEFKTSGGKKFEEQCGRVVRYSKEGTRPYPGFHPIGGGHATLLPGITLLDSYLFSTVKVASHNQIWVGGYIFDAAWRSATDYVQHYLPLLFKFDALGLSDPSFRTQGPKKDDPDSLDTGADLSIVQAIEPLQNGTTLILMMVGTQRCGEKKICPVETQVRRLLATGQLDSTFADAGVLKLPLGGTLQFPIIDGHIQYPIAGGPSVLAAQVDGSILVAGSPGTADSAEIVLNQFKADGKPDPAFSEQGKRTYREANRVLTVSGVSATPDGNWAVLLRSQPVSGTSGLERFEVLEFQTSGALNLAFSGGVVASRDFAYAEPFSLEVDAKSGTLLFGGVVGDSSNTHPVLVRLLASGVPDGSFSQKEGTIEVIPPHLDQVFGRIAVTQGADGSVFSAVSREPTQPGPNFGLTTLKWIPAALASGSIDFRFQGCVDGEDILTISGKEVSIQHHKGSKLGKHKDCSQLGNDSPTGSFAGDLAGCTEVSLIHKDTNSRIGAEIILEQAALPAKIRLSDPAKDAGLFQFDLLCIKH